MPLDKAQSAAWLQKAAERGYVYAQEMLGSDYLAGEGVPRDYAEAYFWFDIACASKAREVVDGIRATQRDAAAVYLSPAELSREQGRARKWLEDHPRKRIRSDNRIAQEKGQFNNERLPEPKKTIRANGFAPASSRHI